MAITVVFAGTNDNEITSSNAAYATARSGGTLTLGDVNSTFLSYGQRNFGSGFDCYESFLEYAYSAVATDLKVSAYFQYVALQNVGTVDRDLRVYEKDWGGGTLTTADWVSGLSIATGSFLGRVMSVQSWGGGVKAKLGSPVLVTRLATTGNVRVVNCSGRFQAGNQPSGDEYNKIDSTGTSGTANDPCMIYTTVRRSTLSWVGAASAQLSDGTNVHLESDGAATPVVTLKYRTTAGSVGTIATVPIGSSGFDVTYASMQKLALVVDASDNIYIIGMSNGSNNDIMGKAYQKSGALTWTAKTALTSTAPAYPNSTGYPHNGVGAWHNTGSSGHIMYVGCHVPQTGDTAQVFYCVLSCASLLAGSGTLFTDSAADPAWLGLFNSVDYVNYPNESGSLLDVVSLPTNSTTGQVHMADADGTTCGRYVLSAGGVASAASGSSSGFIGDAISVDKDANSKIRTHVLADGRYINTNGCRVVARQSNGVLLGFDDLDANGITNFPTAAAQRGLFTWDSILDLANNKVWIYYLDSTDSRVLRRTGFSLSTYQGTNESVSVNSTIGATGTTNIAIRVPRGQIDERHVSIAVANVTGAGALSTVYVDDSFNIAPSAPLLGAVPVFDATTPHVFSWTFGDANPKDTQTAYQLVIIRTSDGVTMLDTGKVTSTSQTYTLPANTLSNAVAYQWRVRTYDIADATGTYAQYTDFTTSGGGSVTITDPATDNPGGQTTADYSITWSVSGTTQASYRVKAIDTVDSSTYYDSGFVTSVSTTAVAPNLLSGHTYRIEVTVRNAALAVSNPGTRLISPVYDSPEAPNISVTAMDTFIRIDVDNPAPIGSEPDVIENLIYRRLTGEVDWTLIATIGRSSTFDDYNVAAGVSYDYKATGVA